jgi:hypothetical protein
MSWSRKQWLVLLFLLNVGVILAYFYSDWNLFSTDRAVPIAIEDEVSIFRSFVTPSTPDPFDRTRNNTDTRKVSSSATIQVPTRENKYRQSAFTAGYRALLLAEQVIVCSPAFYVIFFVNVLFWIF